MTRALLGLGANLGDRAETLRRAIVGLGAREEVVIDAVSDLYETEPVGGPAQGLFLNLVVAVATTLDARGLLSVARELEDEAGRVRIERWGPRTLDVDVLWVDGERVDDPDLVVPHPRMWERRFVVEPLAEIAPDLLGPGWRERAQGAVRRLGPL